MIGRKRTAALALILLLLAPGAAPGGGGTASAAVKIKKILPTFLCAGEEAPVRESPKESAETLWTLEMNRIYRTDRHTDQYYVLTDDSGTAGFVSKGAVRILNAKDLTAGLMFKLPHVAPGVPRQPVEPVMTPGVTYGEAGMIFLPEAGWEEEIPAGERVYVFSIYGNYAAVWHRGRLGYVMKDRIRLLKTDGQPDSMETISPEAYRESLRTETGSIQASPVLTEALSMLEEGNPIALRYEKLTGQKTEPLFPAGVPYFWGGQDEKILTERYPEYTTRKQWQGTHDFYQKDSVYIYGLDCVGYVTAVFRRAGLPLGETLNDLGDRQHCKEGAHLFCSAEHPFPADWTETAKSLRPGDLLALHHPGRHAMIYIGTLRDYGYTEEQLPAAAEFLDYPLMIHCGENPFAYQRFDCLTARSADSRLSKAMGSDGGVSLCIPGVPKEAAETVVTAHESSYFCFEAEGACITVMRFDNVKDYYVFRNAPAGS